VAEIDELKDSEPIIDIKDEEIEKKIELETFE
jgi:hypothetical protein